MSQGVLIATSSILALCVIALFGYIIYLRKSVKTKQKDINRRIYELAVLREISDRAGYSLDVHKIVDIITGSLGQLIDYSVAAYMLFDEDKLIFKADLERSVSKIFIKTVESRMMQSLGALLERDVTKLPIDESVSGAVVVDDADTPVRSFFNIPLVISGKVVGVLTVADTEEGKYRGDETTILYKLTNQASEAVTRLEEVVGVEQERVRSMVESLSDGVLMTDSEYRIDTVNPAARSVIGVDENEDITIFNFMDAIGGAFNIRGKLEESMALKKVLTEKGVLIKDRFFDIVVSPVYRGHGNDDVIIGGLVIFRDVTSSIHTDQIRKDFISMLVHELRAPIDGIKKTVEALKNPKRKMPKERQSLYMDLIHTNTQRMLLLINDLLDASRVEAGRFAVIKSDVSLRDIVIEQSGLYNSQAQDAGISLIVETAPEVPETLPADPDRLKQVMSNMLSNAVKYASEGGTIAVRTFLQRKKGDFADTAHALMPGFEFFGDAKITGRVPAVVVAVTNTGDGLSEEALETIFNKFVQFTRERKRGQQGTGLGLVIAKGIVEAHGGEIGVVSREGEGITFYFTIPLK